MGCTFQEDEVFESLISYIEAGEIRPFDEPDRIIDL